METLCRSSWGWRTSPSLQLPSSPQATRFQGNVSWASTWWGERTQAGASSLNFWQSRRTENLCRASLDLSSYEWLRCVRNGEDEGFPCPGPQVLRGQTATDKRWEGNGIPQRRFAPTSYTNSPTQNSRTRRGVSPSRGGAFLLRKLTRERAGLSGERVFFRPHAVSVPRVARRDHGCSWEGGPDPPRVPRQDDSGLSGGCGSTYQFGFVFRFLFVGGPVPRAPLVAPAHAGFLAAASSSRRRRPELLHLSLALSPAALEPHVSSRAKAPRSAPDVPRPRTERIARQAPLPGPRVSPIPGNPDATTPVLALRAGASPAPKQLQSPRSPPPSGRC